MFAQVIQHGLITHIEDTGQMLKQGFITVLLMSLIWLFTAFYILQIPPPSGLAGYAHQQDAQGDVPSCPGCPGSTLGTACFAKICAGPLLESAELIPVMHNLSVKHTVKSDVFPSIRYQPDPPPPRTLFQI
ncbi:hypothetical protein [Parasulfitobacter algicola]|uniref:Uncharacterized protein n=1 Tax=Parasulfitobacter algicola TaxID=2614809 RepID=A0ABX2IPC0_9RHOB|nr:hypothetical protein [Sulfitobacter algicola]NSX54739.1 hypothetical protein [Sulfitobacter algicola]